MTSTLAIALTLVLSATGLPAAAFAQPSGAAFPAKPLRIISPYSPGGLGDSFPRAVASGLAESLGQPVIVENRPGASQAIGMQVAAKAPPDGHTMVFGSVTSLAINPAVSKELPYDPVKDFAPLSLCVTTPLYLVVHPSVPATTVKDLVALARRQPGRLTFASGGNGSSNHLAGELLKLLAGIDMIHVPYKGNAPTLTDLLGGQVSMTFGIAHQFLPHVKTGRLRAIAVTTAKRTAFAPQLPTIAESGLEGYEISAWQGILAPAGTAKEIVGRMSSEIGRILRQPDVVERLTAEGAEPVASTPEAFGEYLRAELARWSRIGREAGIRIE